MKRVLNLLTLPSRRPKVGQTPSDEVHRENKWRLLRYRGRPGGRAFKTPVLLVPSLINKHYVLDLMPQKSFVEYLVAQGHDTFIIDWGTPGPEDRYLGFDDVCDRYIGRAVRLASEHGESERIHLLGYCLGGTLAAIHTAVRPEKIASLSVLAAPVRFHDDGLLSRWTRTATFDVDALVDACGNVPWQLMQTAFHLLRPTLTLSKMVSVLDRAWNDEFLDGFMAVETWGNDNVSFPGRCYKEYIEGLYRADGLVNRTFRLSGNKVELANIRCPTRVVTFEHDNIVPWRSAAALMDEVGAQDKERIHLPGGHVGAVVSKNAAKGLWPKLSDFWAGQDAPPQRARPVRRKSSGGMDARA